MTVVVAPAKLTVSLRIVGVREDGYHLVDAEMVTLDLVDTLFVGNGDGLEFVDETDGDAMPLVAVMRAPRWCTTTRVTRPLARRHGTWSTTPRS